MADIFFCLGGPGLKFRARVRWTWHSAPSIALLPAAVWAVVFFTRRKGLGGLMMSDINQRAGIGITSCMGIGLSNFSQKNMSDKKFKDTKDRSRYETERREEFASPLDRCQCIHWQARAESSLVKRHRDPGCCWWAGARQGDTWNKWALWCSARSVGKISNKWGPQNEPVASWLLFM